MVSAGWWRLGRQRRRKQAAAAQNNSITNSSLINRVVVGITLTSRVMVVIKHIGNLYWMIMCFCCFRAYTYKQKSWLIINFNANCSAAHKSCSLLQAHWFGTYMSWIMPTKSESKKILPPTPKGVLIKLQTPLFD